MSVARQFKATEPMPPKLDEKSETVRMQLVLPKSLVETVEDWRAKQRPVPNMSEAIRRLVVLGTKQGDSK